MDNEKKVVLINDLPSSTEVLDDDVFIKSNSENTEIITAELLKQYFSQKYEHPLSGVKSGKYTLVNVNEYGHVISGENPNTLEGYGITDGATKIELQNEISRALKAEEDLENSKANINSPTFTGTPQVPTPSEDTDTNQIASTKFINRCINTHNSSSSAHDDIRILVSELEKKLNSIADSDDTTLDQLSEIVKYIKSNKTLIDQITTSKINVVDIVDDLSSDNTNKPLSARQGKVLNELIENLSLDFQDKIEDIRGDSIIGVQKSGNTYNLSHNNILRKDTSSNKTLNYGDSFSVVKNVSSDNKGHIVSAEIETLTLPSGADIPPDLQLFSWATESDIDNIINGSFNGR